MHYSKLLLFTLYKYLYDKTPLKGHQCNRPLYIEVPIKNIYTHFET